MYHDTSKQENTRDPSYYRSRPRNTYEEKSVKTAKIWDVGRNKSREIARCTLSCTGFNIRQSENCMLCQELNFIKMNKDHLLNCRRLDPEDRKSLNIL